MLRRAAGHAQPATARNHRVKDGAGQRVDGHAPRLVGDELGHHGARDTAEVEHVGERVHGITAYRRPAHRSLRDELNGNRFALLAHCYARGPLLLCLATPGTTHVTKERDAMPL